VICFRQCSSFAALGFAPRAQCSATSFSFLAARLRPRFIFDHATVSILPFSSSPVEAACALSAPLFSAVDSDLEFVFFPDVLLPAYFVCFLISAPACCFLLAAVFPAVSSVLDSYSDFFLQALVASFYSAVPFLFLFLFGALCFAAGEKFLLGILVPTCTHHF
jgi:hypothetical protein